MKMTIHSNSNLEITTAMRSYIEGELKKLIETVPEDASIICSCKVAKNSKGLEVTVISKEYTVRAESYCDDFYDAVDKVIDKAIKSARKYHKKLIDMKRKQTKKECTEDNFNLEIESKLARDKEIVAVPMDTERAMLQLDTLDHDFFLYLDSETLLPCVLYKRIHGGIGKLTLVKE